MRDSGQQRGFAGVGITHESNFGNDAKLENEAAFFAGLARLRKARGLVCSGRKITISQAAASSFAKHEALAVLGEIGSQLALGRSTRKPRCLGFIFAEVNFHRLSADGAL